MQGRAVCRDLARRATWQSSDARRSPSAAMRTLAIAAPVEQQCASEQEAVAAGQKTLLNHAQCISNCMAHIICRVLGALDLVLLGIGCIIGAGIMVLTGVAAHKYAG